MIDENIELQCVEAYVMSRVVCCRPGWRWVGGDQRRLGPAAETYAVPCSQSSGTHLHSLPLTLL